MNLKISLSFFLLLYLSNTVLSQTLSNTVIASGGNYSTASWGSLSATAGEAVTTTLPSASVTLLQGFQQPTSGLTGITSVKTKLTECNVYPNPATNEVFIEVTLPNTTLINYKIFDLNGKEIIAGNFTADALHTAIQKLDFSGVSSGMYLVSLYSDPQNIQNIKIQINH